ncbi:MAG: hypothetical protein JW919_05120 [Candidatus Omnitrophica bacterium]|nr:hypothetical protein [Candidatus Omnitrophota bacterium]
MKKIAMLTAVILLAGFVAVAGAQSDDPVRDLVKTTGTFFGKIVYVATGGSGGDKTDIIVKDEKGQEMPFVVDETAKVVGSTANLLTCGELKKGQKVQVEYTKEAGKQKAKAVTVTK